MSNLYVVLTSHDTVTDVGRASTFRRIFNSRSLQTKSTKNEGPSENMGFNGKPVWRFQTVKRTETIFLTFQKKNPMENKEPYMYQSIMDLVNSKG